MSLLLVLSRVFTQVTKKRFDIWMDTQKLV